METRNLGGDAWWILIKISWDNPRNFHQPTLDLLPAHLLKKGIDILEEHIIVGGIT